MVFVIGHYREAYFLTALKFNVRGCGTMIENDFTQKQLQETFYFQQPFILQMIKNYFKIAIRNLVSQRVFSLLNISGLAVGMAACLILFTVVKYELSYDTFQPNYKRIYHVVTKDRFAEGVTYNPGIMGAAIDALRTQMPSMIFGTISAANGAQITVGNTNDKKFIEENGMFFCDPQFFKVFEYKWLQGEPNVLKNPNTVVLTEQTATKYFGNWQDAIGKTIRLDNAITLKVSGILDDIPLNTDFPLSVIASFETLKNNGPKYNYYDDWHTLSSNVQLFTLLPPNANETDVNKQFQNFSKENYVANRVGTQSVRTNFLQPLSRLHFDTRFEIFGTHITSMSVIWTLVLIGIFIIIMASINFINLATAQAAGRSKEVGIRKVLGSNRLQLFVQVIGETAVLVTIAMMLAVVMAVLCLPYIGHIASIEEKLSLLNVPTVLFILSVILLVTVLAGMYPSFVLARYNAAAAIKNKINSARVGGIPLRRSLVVVQFIISQVLIIGTIIAIRQMDFVNHADLGFDKESVLVLSDIDNGAASRVPAFKQSLLQIPGVESVTFATDVPSSENNWSTNFAYDHRPDEKFQVSLKFGDEDYFKTFGLTLVAGRVYDKSDTTKEVVVNETLLKKVGVSPQDAIGKDIDLGQGPWKKIVGVVKDFKTKSLKSDIDPLLIAEKSSFYSVGSVKLKTSNIRKTVAAIQSDWNRFFPEYVCTTSFLDENIAKFYEQDTHLELLYKIFAGLAIFISCLGLYGLVSFMATQKTKEIGVRKVLGASVANIVYLFSKEFVVLIAIAFVVAAPAAYLIMKSWLNDFVYRVPIGVGVFLVAVFISVVIGSFTVGYKAFKAAVANPVKSLRSE